VLLERIREERRRKAKESGKAFREPPTLDTSSLPELPEGWEWARMADTGEIQLGRQRSPANRSKNYPTPYIRAANITENGLDLSDVLEMEFTPDERERFALAGGDLMVSEASGSPEQVGKPAIWQQEMSLCCFQNTVIRLRPRMNHRFLLWLLKHHYVTSVFARTCGGVNINHLSAGKFAEVLVPVAPEAEQTVIVQLLENCFSLADKAAVCIDLGLKQSQRLRQSILKRAFQGRLVPQDPNDEPADRLLERIKAEKTKLLSNMPRRKANRKPAECES